jgi:polysaccharide chain length determinant protein (PEP-CTERM system associated)
MNGNDVDAFEDAPSTRGLLEYLEIPLWYPKQMWIPFFVIMLIAITGIFLLPRKFRSSTMIMVEPKKVADYFVMPMANDGIAQRLNTIRQIVLSRTALEKIVQTYKPYPELGNTPTQVVADLMRKAISIRVQGSDSFIIEYVNKDPRTAMLVTNALAEQFVEDSTFLHDNMTEKTYEFIQSNLADTRKVLESREEALRQHKLKYWGALPEQLESNLRVMGQLQTEQQTLAENLRTLVERRGALEKTLADAGRLGPAALAASTPTRAAELAKLKITYAALRDRYTEEHPDVRAVKHKIDRLEEAMASAPSDTPSAEPDTSPEILALHRSLQATEAEIDTLNERRTALDARITAFQARVEQTPKAEQELMALTRDYNQIRDNYNASLKKEMDAEMSRKLEEYWKDGYFRILDPAHLPQRPIRPYATLLTFGGLALGLFAGLACTVVADFLDGSVKNIRQMESLLPYPVLVSIPHTRARRSRRAPTVAPSTA